MGIEAIANNLKEEFLKKGYCIDDAEAYEVAKYNLEEEGDNFNVKDYVNETIEKWPETIAQFKIGCDY